jgi:hypothetical protein
LAMAREWYENGVCLVGTVTIEVCVRRELQPTHSLTPNYKLHLPTFFYFLDFGFAHQFSYKFVTDLHHSFIYCEGHKTRNQRLGGHFYPHNQWIIIFQQIFLFDCLFVWQ